MPSRYGKQVDYLSAGTFHDQSFGSSVKASGIRPCRERFRYGLDRGLSERHKMLALHPRDPHSARDGPYLHSRGGAVLYITLQVHLPCPWLVCKVPRPVLGIFHEPVTSSGGVWPWAFGPRIFHCLADAAFPSVAVPGGSEARTGHEDEQEAWLHPPASTPRKECFHSG